MALNQLTAHDIADSSALRRRVEAFINLCRLAVNASRDALRGTYMNQARDILRNLFGTAPKHESGVLSLRDSFETLLQIANAIVSGKSIPYREASLAYAVQVHPVSYRF